MEAQDFISTCDCPDFLRKAERRLAEEADRVSNYLDASTEPKVTRVVEETLIGKQARLLAMSGFAYTPAGILLGGCTASNRSLLGVLRVAARPL